MSKFFFKGRPDVMGKYGKAGYKPEPNVKLGTASKPLNLSVQTAEREQELLSEIAKLQLVANIVVNAEENENISDLDAVLNKPKTQVFEKTPERNDPCSCGSGKKYKKCCS